jgi:hypothetical protein
MRPVDLLHHLADNHGACGIGELGELTEMFVDGAARARPLERRTDEEGPFNRRCDRDQFSAYLKILEKVVSGRCRSS